MALPPHIDLQIVTPDRRIVPDQGDGGELPGSERHFVFPPGHTPFPLLAPSRPWGGQRQAGPPAPLGGDPAPFGQ